MNAPVSPGAATTAASATNGQVSKAFVNTSSTMSGDAVTASMRLTARAVPSASIAFWIFSNRMTQPLSPEVAMPSMKKRCPSRKMIAIGMTEIVSPVKSIA